MGFWRPCSPSGQVLCASADGVLLYGDFGVCSTRPHHPLPPEHPNIVVPRVHGASSLVYDTSDALPLSHILTARAGSLRFFSSRAAAHLCVQIADALACLHAHGFRHAVQTESVFVHATGKAMLVDAPQAIPAIHVRAPEVVLLQAATAAADVWALGCVLFALLELQELFQPHVLARQPEFARFRTEYEEWEVVGSDAFAVDMAHLSQMRALQLGTLPRRMCHRKFFSAKGKLCCQSSANVSLRALVRRRDWLDTLCRILVYDPTLRPSAVELRSDFSQKLAVFP